MFYSLPLQLIPEVTGINPLRTLRGKKLVFSSFFINRIRPAWKVLHEHCFNCNTVCSFKSKFKTVNVMKFMNSNV